MSDKTGIQWTDSTWNPIVGCSIKSPACTNCYAMEQAAALERRFGSEKYTGLTKIAANGKPVWTGEVRMHEPALDQPLRWRRGRRIFVNSMSDLFHENLPDEEIDRIFAVMALCPQHTFQVLTKRPERMREYVFARAEFRHRENIRWIGNVQIERKSHYGGAIRWPLPNVWLGVTAEDQERANERIPILLDTPTATRFISAEPLLGPLDLTRLPLLDIKPGWEGCRRDALNRAFSGCPFKGDAQAGTMRIETPYAAGLDWVIVGGESGKDARPIHPNWVRALRDQCQAAGVPFFFKQWGRFAPRDPEEWPVQGYIETRGSHDTTAWPDGTIGPGHKDRNGGHGWPLDPAHGRLKHVGRLLDGREHSEFPA